MNRFDFDWVDAFSPAPFGGNGCAVVHGGARLSAETAMAYTRATGLVECTFTGPSEVADIRVRYFLADREIPFAGHPTLATVAAMRDRGMITGASVTLETGAGIVPVTLDGEMIEMTQVAPTYGAELDPSMVAQALRLSPEDIAAPPQVVSTGTPFCIAVIKDKAALKRARLNLDLFAEMNPPGTARASCVKPGCSRSSITRTSVGSTITYRTSSPTT